MPRRRVEECGDLCGSAEKFRSFHRLRLFFDQIRVQVNATPQVDVAKESDAFETDALP